MINKLYKDDTIENLKIFSDLKIPIEYSNMSKEYNSYFNEFTYSKFYNNLKNYNNKLKSININSFYSISSKSKKNKSQNFREFDILKIKSAIEKMKEKENMLKQKREHPYTERCLNSNPIYTLLKDKIRSKKREEERLIGEDIDKKNNTPEIGRYNPLYNSINKHTHQTVFSLKNFEEYNSIISKQKMKLNKKLNNHKTKSYENNNKNNMTESKNNIKIPNKTSTLNFNTDDKINYISDKENESKNKINKDIFYNTAIVRKRKNKNESRNMNKNNHCLRFETYCPRKPLINKIFYQTENNLQKPKYGTPKNIKGSIIFNKVSSNKNSKNYFEKLINQKKNIPSLGFYRPNYSSVTHKTMNVFFDGRKNEKNNMKFMKLKKILGSYYVRGEYQLFNLLNNKNKDSSKDNIN